MSSTDTLPLSKFAAAKNVDSINTKINPETITGKCIFKNDFNAVLVLLFLKIGMDLLMILTIYVMVSIIPIIATITEINTGMNLTKKIMNRPKMMRDNHMIAILI